MVLGAGIPPGATMTPAESAALIAAHSGAEPQVLLASQPAAEAAFRLAMHRTGPRTLAFSAELHKRLREARDVLCPRAERRTTADRRARV